MDQGIASETTLKSAINNLVDLSWQLNAIIYGERPAKEEATESIAQNNLVELRNKVTESNKRVEEVIKGLSQLK